jgi:hypothetical protein
MDGFHWSWNLIAAGLAGAGTGFAALQLFGRLRLRRRAAAAGRSEPERRIDVVAIDAPTQDPKRETTP